MIFRKIKKETLFPWAILLSMAILCAQCVKLHVHDTNHDFGQQHGPLTANDVEGEAVGEVEGHSHLTVAHLSADTSHADHHDEVLSEVDASPDVFLNKVANNIPVLALLAGILILCLLAIYRYPIHRRRHNDALSFWRYYHSPPLRAPPL